MGDALDATEARFAKAQAANVGTFAPSPMANAELALREARRYTERFQNDPDLVRQSMSLFFGETMGDKTLGLIAEANDALMRGDIRTYNTMVTMTARGRRTAVRTSCS